MITDLSQENAYRPKIGVDCKGLHITTLYDKLDLTAPNRRVTHIAKES